MMATRLKQQAALGAGWSAIALGFSIPISVALDNVLLLLFLLCWFASGDFARKSRVILAHPVAIVALVYAALTLAGIAWSEAPSRRLFNAAGDALRFLLIGAFIPVFLDETVRRRSENAFLAASVIILLLSFILWSGLTDHIPGTKGNGTNPVVFKYHITHNLLMAMAALMFVLRSLDAPDRRQQIMFGLLAAAAAMNVLLMIPGRTGQLALIAGMLYIGIARLRWKGLALVTATVATLAAYTWMTPASVMHQRIALGIAEAQAWQPGQAAPDTSSVGLRLEYYSNALGFVPERPIFGYGAGAFSSLYEDRIRGTAMTHTAHPHNAFLQVTVELGVVGLLALLAVLLTQWRAAATLTNFSQRASARSLVVVYTVAGMFSATFVDHAEGLFFAWASALLFARATWPRRTA